MVVAQEIVLFPDHAEIFPADAIVDRQVLGHVEAVLQVERLVVLEGLAAGVTLSLASAVGSAGDEIVEAVEAQLGAIAAVEEAIHRGPAELPAELPVVASVAVADVVEELPVGVDTSPGHGSVC